MLIKQRGIVWHRKLRSDYRKAVMAGRSPQQSFWGWRAPLAGCTPGSTLVMLQAEGCAAARRRWEHERGGIAAPLARADTVVAQRGPGPGEYHEGDGQEWAVVAGGDGAVCGSTSQAGDSPKYT